MPPWEKYQAKAQPTAKPWEKFAPPTEQRAPAAIEPEPVAQAPTEEPSELKQMLRSTLEHPVTQAGLKGLDYVGGLARTGLQYSPPAMAVRAATDTLPTMEQFKSDVVSAYKGEAPSTSGFLEKVGAPEGPSLYGIPARDAAGFVGDVALDPLTYLTGGVSTAGKLGNLGKVASKMVNPARGVSKAAGEVFFKSAFKPIDNALKKAGQKGVTSELMKEGIGGSWEAMAKKVPQIQKDVGRRVASAVDDVEKAGVPMLNNLAQSKAMVRQNLRDDLISPKQAEAFLSKIERYTANPSVIQANNWKKAAYQKGKQSFRKGRGATPASKIHGRIGLDLKNSVEATSKSVSDDLYKTIKKGNEYWAQLATANKEALKQTTKTPSKLGKLAGAGTDIALVGSTSYAYGFDPKAALALLAARRLLTSPKTRAKVLSSKFLTHTDIPSSAARRGLINLGDDDEQNTK